MIGLQLLWPIRQTCPLGLLLSLSLIVKDSTSGGVKYMLFRAAHLTLHKAAINSSSVIIVYCFVLKRYRKALLVHARNEFKFYLQHLKRWGVHNTVESELDMVFKPVLCSTNKELCFGWYMVIRLLVNLWPDIICGFQ